MDHLAQKSILIINYYWPPAGGPAVQRWVDIIKNWSESDVSCIVLTVDEVKATYQVIDKSIEKQVPGNVKIFRTNTSEFFSSYKKYIGNLPANAFVNQQNPTLKQKIARFIRGNFFIPDPRKGWNKFAYKKALDIIRNYAVKVIITAGPPHSTHLIGLKLQKKLEVKWIADFHDYWTDIFYLKDFYRTPPAKWVDNHFEKKVLRNADLVLTHCQYARKLYLKKLESIAEEKILVHTMGYDSRIFEPDQKFALQSAFTITYTGMMPENYNPDIFFKVMGRVVKHYSETPIIIRFIGLFSPSIKNLVIKYGLEKHWKESGYIEHSEIPGYLNSSSALLLVNPNVKDEEMIVPGKIYEYLAVRKPIISISGNNSENAYLLELCEAGENFERNHEEGLYHFLSDLIETWKVNKQVDLTNSNNNFQNFSRSYEAAKLLEKIFTIMESI